jgi:hypothetical protein
MKQKIFSAMTVIHSGRSGTSFKCPFIKQFSVFNSLLIRYEKLNITVLRIKRTKESKLFLAMCRGK